MRSTASRSGAGAVRAAPPRNGRSASRSPRPPRRAAPRSPGEAPPASAAAVAARLARSGSGSSSWVPQAGSGLRNAQITRVPGASLASSARSRTAVCAEWPAPASRMVLPAQSPASRGEVGDVAPDLAREGALSPGAGMPPSPRRVGIAVGAGGVDHHVRSLGPLAAGAVREEEAEGAAAALGRGDLLVLEQPLAADGQSTRVPSRRWGAISGSAASGSSSRSASSRPVGHSEPSGTSRPAASRWRRMRGRDVHLPGREQPDVPPGADVAGGARARPRRA